MKKILVMLALGLAFSMQTTAQGKDAGRKHATRDAAQDSDEDSGDDEEDEPAPDKEKGGKGSRGQKPKANVDEIMSTISGVGLDFYRPGLMKGATLPGPWVGINAMMDGFEIQVGFGKLNADRTKADPAQFADGNPIGDPAKDVYGSNVAIQYNHPLGASWAGINSRKPRALLRGGFFLAGGGGYMTVWEGNKGAKGSLLYLDVAPGFRLFNEFLTAEIRLQGMTGIKKDNGYDAYLQKTAFMPMLTLRANGGFFRLLQSRNRVATATTTTNYVGSDYYYNYYMTTTSHGSTILNNIGRYIGVGPRLSFTAPANDVFYKPGYLVGVNGQLRYSKLIVGLNAETGTIRHGSILKGKRTVDGNLTTGNGSLKATNIFADLGLDITSVIMALGGTSRDDGGITTFTALSFGYSVGYGLLGNQRFDNPASANAYYDGIQHAPDAPATAATDPRLSKSGLVSGFFLGLEVGNAGFRMQWYRHRNAPLANNLFYTLSYRIGKSKRK